MTSRISPVGELISSLNNLYIQKSPLVSTISNFHLLISSLRELDSMIEMDTLKESVISQLKYLLISNNTIGGDGIMLHTVLYGPPGVGKTKVGTILAKIWASLGLLKRNNLTSGTIPNKLLVDGISKPSMQEQLSLLASSNKFKIGVIERLQEELGNIKDNIKELIPVVRETKANIRTLKRHLDSEVKTNMKKRKKNNAFLESTLEELKLEELEKRYSETIGNLDELEEVIKHDTSKFIPDEKVKFISHVTPSIPDKISQDIQKDININDLIVIAGKQDFCAGYLGQTALKTEALLKKSLGKVLFIDEAYSIINGERDEFGMEALTILNRFMSEHSHELIVIFAGYKELMEKTIFIAQPGLKRRCTWIFEVDDYTPEGMTKIFLQQMNSNGWIINHNIDLINFFKSNMVSFPAYGGDTLRLSFYCKTVYADFLFQNELIHNGETNNIKIINREILDKAFKLFSNNKIDKKILNNHSYNMIYV